MPLHKLDSYLDLCTQVYDLSKPKPPEDAYGFYRSYVAEANGTILEPMCGTGRFLLPLRKEGFDVRGFDASDYMLEALYAKADYNNLNPLVWKGFIEDLQRPEKYKLIFIPSGSFCLITDPTTAREALKTLYDHLDKDGLLVLEAITTKWQSPPSNVWTGDVWYREDGKFIILSSFSLPDKDYIRHSIARYELVDKGQIIQAEIEDFRVRLYKPESLIPMLNEAGFQDIRMIKTFDRAAQPSDHDEEIVYECRR